jgi:hypothetical protein
VNLLKLHRVWCRWITTSLNEWDRYIDQIDKDLADGSSAGIQVLQGIVICVLDKDGNVDGRL